MEVLIQFGTLTYQIQLYNIFVLIKSMAISRDKTDDILSYLNSIIVYCEDYKSMIRRGFI